MDNKTSKAWDSVFRKLRIEKRIKSNGFEFVTAKEIKKFGKREPRLMANLLTREARPDVLKKYTVLPTRNGTYGIYDFDGYHNLEKLPKIQEYRTNNLSNLETINVNKIKTESQVIDIAHIASVLSDFTNEDKLVLTIRGKQRSGSFSFNLDLKNKIRTNVEVNNAGIEIDSGYEGNRIYLVEAKIGDRDNFLVRQLFYPFRAYKETTQKEVVPIFLTYTNKVFHFWQYKFSKGLDYQSLSFVKGARYVINESPKEIFSINEITSRIPTVTNPKQVPFPQADDFSKVIDVIDAVERGVNTKVKIANYYEYDERQADYYSNAASYLGFIEKRDRWNLTKIGNEIKGLSREERIRLILIQLLNKRVIRDSFELYINQNKTISKEQIVSIIQKHLNLNSTTAGRRALTVMRWIEWIAERIK